MWTLYDQLIERSTVEDTVVYAHQGENWTMIKTRCGRIGIAATHPSRSGKALDSDRVVGMPIAQAAVCVKSWDFEWASFGLAAINAIINDARTLPITANPDAFLRYKDKCIGKKVAVVGHFAYLEKRLAGLCDLYVLERKPCSTDYPDAACEYLLPSIDVVFITGSALANKTMPRLLELSAHAYTIIAGPSTPMCPDLMKMGADALCGFCVMDEALCEKAVNECGGMFNSGRMICMERDEYQGGRA